MPIEQLCVTQSSGMKCSWKSHVRHNWVVDYKSWGFLGYSLLLYVWNIPPDGALSSFSQLQPPVNPSKSDTFYHNLGHNLNSAQEILLNSIHKPVLCTIPCRPGTPCCCSHSCRVRVALQWLGVGQHSPTTSPAIWIPEDSNHCQWKEETVRSPRPHTSLCHLFPLCSRPCTSVTPNDLSFL